MVGQKLGRYQVRRLLGQGGMGQVYLARDVVLGRSVALKIVGGTHDTDRFLDEARAIARLNHPNIVQLYDFGLFDDNIYLALEYIDGITLRERARPGLLELDEVLRHMRAVADALQHAHASLVFHCDLKPSNIMIGRDGRIRVVDFGLARTSETGAHTAGGTPDWMAPEQWANDTVDDRVDSWALGIITAELLTGQHPLGEEQEQRRTAARDSARVAAFSCARTDVAPAIVELVARSLEYLPAQRPSAVEWKRSLDDAVSGRGDALDEDGPYPGLAAFAEPQARFYFGREPEIDEFLERLREVTVLPIVGPSGAGKSSFLHAGVIPRLRAREKWCVIGARPGADPLGTLARSVVLAASDRPGDHELKVQAGALRADLLQTPTLLAARLATMAHALEAHVLVAIDQFEEVFTQCASEPERAAFLRALLSASDDPIDPVRVVFTVRDDFLGQIPGVRALFVMQRLGAGALRRTVTGPLARYRYELDDPTLLDDLIGEVGAAEAADLPLLQFACRTLWDGRDPVERKLRRVTYTEMGGVAGALAHHAERALAQLTPDERRIARLILLQLVSGTTRRTVARARLAATLGPAADPVIDKLTATRLLVQRVVSTGDDDGGNASIEIAHESLLATWGQLARWIDESRDERRLLDELDDAASLWERRGQRSDETWAHDDLVAARHRATQLDVKLPPRIEQFLAAGDERARRARRRLRLRLGALAAVVGALAVAGVIYGGRYVARERAIKFNVGTVELELAPFDIRGGTLVPVPAGELQLAWELWATDNGNVSLPSSAVPDELVERHPAHVEGGHLVQQVSAPGGAVVLRITGRNRPGDPPCAAAWVPIVAFPGYSASDVHHVPIEVPTCQASRADTIEVPAGEFIYGGDGERPTRMKGQPDYTMPEKTVSLGAFRMDRTEVSNRAFEPFARLSKITGFQPPVYSVEPPHDHDGDPGMPVTDVDAFTAAAFCHYFGKELPTDKHWVKAARGGLVIGGAPNPAPRRLFPWGTEMKPACVSLGYDETHWMATVDSFACGASPYGILNLVGNAEEWISDVDQPDTERLHVLRGGAVDAVDAPAGHEQTSTVFINHREPRAYRYSIGFRCVVDVE